MKVARFIEKNGIYFGLLVSILYLFNLIKIPSVSLTVLSIFFGGLLSIYLILPCVQNFEQFKFIIKSGHIKDLIDYIRVPVILSLTLIIFDLFRNTINFQLDSRLILVGNSLYVGLWGVFILSLIRIIIILPKILLNQMKDKKVKKQ